MVPVYTYENCVTVILNKNTLSRLPFFCWLIRSKANTVGRAGMLYTIRCWFVFFLNIGHTKFLLDSVNILLSCTYFLLSLYSWLYSLTTMVLDRITRTTILVTFFGFLYQQWTLFPYFIPTREICVIKSKWR